MTDGQVLYESYVRARGCEPHWDQQFQVTRSAWESAATKLEQVFYDRQEIGLDAVRKDERKKCFEEMRVEMQRSESLASNIVWAARKRDEAESP
jgi:hypothetical protein